MDNCYKPLSQILTRINTHFTVKANSSTNPKNGSAPLNVTFDARASLDPSNETIPSDNYFRYYRDTNWEDRSIGIWPVVNHTFEEPWNYLVHLTVRSSNKTSDWIFDGKKTTSIDVKPKAAVISVFANSKRLKTFEKIKFGTQEWLKWIVLDWSATIAIWWRQILSHSREITSSDWFNFTKQGEWLPGIVKIILPKEWEYKVTLKTYDNESNNISEQYFILISDPVAIIKQSPEQWNTSNTFSFDSNASYSVISKLRLFTREIFNNNGDKIETIQGKSIKHQFKQPWSYTVKLTVEDELGQTNLDTTQVYVDSSEPISQFSIKASEVRQHPSKFVLDASLSSDPDVENWFDELNYSWSFSNPNFSKIVNTEQNNKLVEVSFDSIWEHKIKLTTKDKFGKISETEKTIEIKSTLRPEIFIAPKATTWWNSVNFIVQSNEEIVNYSRDFWDWETISTQTNRVSHVYKSVWIYKVTLKVSGTNWMENTITDNVFIWDKNSPIAAFKVLNNQQEILKQNEECAEIIDGQIKKHPAYKIERYQNFTIDPKESVNIKWENNNLSFYFQPRNWEIFKNTNFKSNFNELWCQFIDFTLEDTSMWINDKVRIRFKVYNALPTISNIILFFPQYWNEMWVGFNENHVRDIFNTEFDPLIVKVQAMEPKDPDGFVSYFKRYYYYKDDPSRPLETKITPGDIPYTFFSLPKIPWEFMFGVTLYDSDDWVNPSEKVIWNWPIVFFPPDTKRPDIPLVTLKANKTTVEVGDEIIFDVVSKIISDRSDFVQERTIYYDFDWNGERDLITKKDRVKHTYTQPSDIWYIPKAAVTYRWYKWVAQWWNIIVKKWLKPRILFENAGKFVLFRDVSLWEIEKSSTCLSFVDCKRENEWFLLDTKDLQVYNFEYPEYSKYFVSIDIEDKYANQANTKQTLILTWIETSSWEYINYTWDFKLLTIPSYQTDEDWLIEILVGKNLNNSVAFYVLFDDPEENKECYIDLDISDENEKDFYCNQAFLQKFDPKYENTIWKLYYQVWDQLLSKELKISFIDFSIELDEKTQAIYEKTTKLINKTKDEKLKALLINLQKWIINPTEIQSNIVAIQDYLLNEDISNITDQEKEDAQWIINELGDSTTISAW
jgi:PKD repeat protein